MAVSMVETLTSFVILFGIVNNRVKGILSHCLHVCNARIHVCVGRLQFSVKIVFKDLKHGAESRTHITVKVDTNLIVEWSQVECSQGLSKLDNDPNVDLAIYELICPLLVSRRPLCDKNHHVVLDWDTNVWISD